MEVGEERLGVSGGLGETEFTGLDTRVEEDGTSETVNTELVFTMSVVVDGHGQVGEVSEKFEIEVSAMIDGTVIVSGNNTGASLPGSEFVHEVQGEESVEGEFRQFSDGFNLFNVLLVLENSLSVETNSVENPLGDGKQVFEFGNEDAERFLEVVDDGSPLILGGSIKIDLISRRVVEMERTRMRNHDGST